MALDLKKRVSDESGQTTVEYLLLLAMAFIVAYFMITGPLSQFTLLMLAQIRSAIANVVQNGELAAGQVYEAGDPGHPSASQRFKALHLQ
jgi:Flp pilus assembly pilin Flp